ncbi:MAG: alpha/beta hydrolase [Gemmatimonadaceae bacterium]
MTKGNPGAGRLRTALLIAASAALLAYAGIVVFLALSENALVYVSAGEGRRGRPVPAEDAPIPWDTLRVPAADGVPVFLLVSRVDTSSRRPWAIFFHGNAGMVGSGSSVARYALLREAGFDVLAPEYRGYGAASGSGPVTEDGVYADARAALAYLVDSLRVPSRRIVAYGWSLGSGPAARLAAEHDLGALITEGGFTSLPDVGAELYPWVPVRMIMRNRFDNFALVTRIEEPWIVFHGRRDSEIPFAHGEALALAGPTARLVPLDAEHDDGVIADRVTALRELRQIAGGLAN